MNDFQRARGNIDGTVPLRTLAQARADAAADDAAMKHPFNFHTGDTPLRLFADTIGLVIFLAVIFLAWEVTP